MPQLKKTMYVMPTEPVSDWLVKALAVAQHRTMGILASLDQKGETFMVGYISEGTSVQKEDGTIVVTQHKWTVVAQRSGNQWEFERDGELFYVNDSDFIPIIGDD